MRKIKTTIFSIIILSFINGCGLAKETAKTVIGSSTRALEQARSDAISKTYYCSYSDCFNAALGLGRKEISAKPWIAKSTDPDNGVFDVMMQDLYAKPPYIVVIGITGNVDTTEVGIFFKRVTQDTIRIDITSLSSIAKRKVAQWVFESLDKNFKFIE